MCALSATLASCALLVAPALARVGTGPLPGIGVVVLSISLRNEPLTGPLRTSLSHSHLPRKG